VAPVMKKRVAINLLVLGSWRTSLAPPNLGFAFELLHDFRDQGRIVLLDQVIDARGRQPELSHRVGSGLPGALALLALGQVQLAYQLRQALPLKRLLVVVKALDDF